MQIDLHAVIPVLAYIGPGAGFAMMGSFAATGLAILLGFLLLLLLPLRALCKWFSKTPPRRGRFRRCIIIGFDGMDPGTSRELMDAGLLPNLARLRQEGCFTALGSTHPPVSPVAWSSFSTGVNPGKHGIFDFVRRDPATYRLKLSSSRIRQRPAGLHRKNNGFTPPVFELLRKSRPFWEILGQHGIFSTILRVPVTFPFGTFAGLGLSGMCVPDLRGTQGEFTLFESSSTAGSDTPGRRIRVSVVNGRVRCSLPGPVVEARAATVALAIRIQDPQRAVLSLQGRKYPLRVGAYTPWLKIVFRSGWRRIHGICRMLPLSLEPDFRLYVTPLHPDPSHPPVPLAHPVAYATYLARRFGPFATLGLSEDTDARNQGVLDNEAFLTQCHDIHQERERIFEDALRHTRRGCCVGVFDLTDRVQHMCGTGTGANPDDPGGQAPARVPDAVADAYQRCDTLVGRLYRETDSQTLLIVMSDHGFGPFRREVCVNAWLREQGFLVHRPGFSGNGGDFESVDWSRTQAYAAGLAGIYLNIRGREREGIVPPGDAARTLSAEIRERLLSLTDPQTKETPVLQVHLRQDVWDGPYQDQGPDLIVGFKRGFRVSWKSAAGHSAGPVFLDNCKAWAGDHCFERDEVPGVLFCNHPVDMNGRDPEITDIAPTLLRLWGIPVPAHMDGTPWTIPPINPGARGLC